MKASAPPGGVDGEEQSESRRRVVVLGDQAFVVALGAEAVFEELGFGDLDGVRLALVGRQLMNERANERDIGGRGGTNAHHEA